jgi:hypothetical protein
VCFSRWKACVRERVWPAGAAAWRQSFFLLPSSAQRQPSSFFSLAQSGRVAACLCVSRWLAEAAPSFLFFSVTRPWLVYIGRGDRVLRKVAPSFGCWPSPKKSRQQLHARESRQQLRARATDAALICFLFTSGRSLAPAGLLKYALAYRSVGGGCRGVLLGWLSCSIHEASVYDDAGVDYGARWDPGAASFPRKQA